VQDQPPDPFAPVAASLGPTNRWMVREGLALGTADGADDLGVTLLTREDALQHIEVLEERPGAGVWLSDRAVERTGLGVGDQADLAGVAVPVVGVYRDLAGTSVDDFWCSTAELLLLEVRGADLVLPPPVVLADPATFATVIEGARVDGVTGHWSAPLVDGLTLSQAEALVPRLACGPGVPGLPWCADGQPPIAEIRGRDFIADPVYAQDDADFVERFLGSSLPFVTERTRAIQTAVGSGIWPVAGVAALAGLGLVVAAASLWFDRRQRDLELLSVRGVSPAALGLKAVLELLLPAVVGAAAGVALARGTVGWLGPAPAVEPDALVDGALAATVVLGVSLAVVAAVVARRAHRLELGTPRRPWVAVVPWELGLVAATVVSYRRLGEWGVPVGRGAALSRVDVVGLLFPVLFLLTGVTLLARTFGLLVGPLRRWSRRWPVPLYLGLRRVARHRVAVTGLVAASAVAAGVLGYAATVERSLEATLDLKARTFVGSDVAVQIPADVDLPPALEQRSTTVVVHRDAWVDLGRRTSIDVLVVEPATLARAAVWDPVFADQPLDSLMAVLGDPRDGVVPAVVVGLDPGRVVEVGIVGAGSTRFDIDPTPVRAFPGMSKPNPTVIVAASALAPLEIAVGMTETWIEGDHDAVLAALDAADVPFEEQRQVVDVADRAAFLTVSWTFAFMRSLAVVAGALALGGAAAYVDARRRERVLAHTFLQRMGLSRSAHRRALAVELVAGLLVGIWSGIAIAVVAARLAHTHLDPVPGFQPDPVLRTATLLMVGFALAGVLLVAGAAALAQRRVDRDDPVEVLRAGG
jgi:putative ABC transport system permease protein